MKNHLKSLKQSIEVWSIHLPDHHAETDACKTLLSSEELARAEKFLKPAAAESYILCRGLLRQTLARYLNVGPSELKFKYNEQGKPFLVSGELEFNVSHSRSRLLIAVTAGRAIGVDIEFRRSGLNMESIAERWFAPEEQAFFNSQGNPEELFFDIWAQKEAYVKALGTGIYKDLNTFAVPLGETPFSPRIGSDGRWFFQSLEIYDANGVIDPAYSAAVVAEAPIVPVNLHTRSDQEK